MAGTAGARQLTQSDIARIIATLAANGGNVKRTSRETGFSAPTVRRYRDRDARGDGPATGLVLQAVDDFVEAAGRVRNKALALLEQRIDSGDIKPSELVTTLGTLDDKIRLANGLATSKVEHTNPDDPSPAELREVLIGVVATAIAMAERRHDEIIDAEIVEEAEPAGLPSAT